MWDFFECNTGFLCVQSPKADISNLSIPFVGFLRMQPNNPALTVKIISLNNSSQFPLWDFFECNREILPDCEWQPPFSLNSLCGISSNATPKLMLPVCGELGGTLNSLCGISSNATHGSPDRHTLQPTNSSQFPLWDFFECNFVSAIGHQSTADLSLNSLCGISSNATFNGEKSRYKMIVRNSQFPLWDFFECNRA